MKKKNSLAGGGPLLGSSVPVSIQVDTITESTGRHDEFGNRKGSMNVAPCFLSENQNIEDPLLFN